MSSQDMNSPDNDHEYAIKECSSSYCRSIIGIVGNKERMYVGACDKANKCSSSGKVDIVVYGEDFAKSIGLPVDGIPPEDRKTVVNAIDECCNTDLCNAKEKTSYKTVTVGRGEESISSNQPADGNSDVSAQPKTNSKISNKSESIFHFYSYIFLFCAFFIAGLYNF